VRHEKAAMTTRHALVGWLCALLLAGCFDFKRVPLGSEVVPDAGDDDHKKSDDHDHSDDRKKTDGGT
jgi:hypothetical protein